MRSQKSFGKRHRLLYYKHTMDRLWRINFLLDIVLWFTWYYRYLGPTIDNFVLGSAVVVLVFTVFAISTRNMSYVQARQDHLRLVTPFMRLKISYRRIKSARPNEFVKIFSPRGLSWADKRFLRPYFSKTALSIILNGFPLPKPILRLFFPKHFFNPQEKYGLVIVVPDWMALSTEYESFQGAWKDKQSQRPRGTSLRGMYGE
ncbi:MAG: hypothetical protein FVQ83_02850 [Chloroflexi bacterium]|nr:hypothetical protein [Chloroflexota bacterium]